MKWINLTPHMVNVRRKDVSMLNIESSGVARVKQESKEVDVRDGIAVITSSYGDVDGLPDPEDGVGYIVSVFVLNAAAETARGAKDLFVPDNPIRDDGGRIIGCGALRTLLD